MGTSTILILCGPALGHVARCAAIASAIRQQDLAVKIVVLVASFCKHTKLIESVGCDIVLADISNKPRQNPAIAYASSLSDLLDRVHVDIILQDCNPTRWLTLADFRNIKRIVVTNSFLTRTANLETHQVKNFANKQNAINAARAKRGLQPLNSPYELYEANTVILADPLPLANLFSGWPEHHICYGPVCWIAKGTTPQTLTNGKRLIIVGMGSTGDVERYLDLLRALKSDKPDMELVLIGKGSTNSHNTELFDHMFDWLPLQDILSRAEICITQGGAGMSYLALAMGSPVLVVPTHRNHELLAKCLEKLHVGGSLTHENLEQLTSMRSVLHKNLSGYDYSKAPIRIAEKIINTIR